MPAFHFPKGIFKHKNEKGVSSLFVFLFLVVLLVAAWFIAHAAFRHLGLFGLWATPFENDKFAFSLPLPALIMYFIYALVLFACFWHIVLNYGRMHYPEAIAWSLVLAGALYNITERIAFGYVRDYIPFAGGVFNVPDFYIIAGVLLLMTRMK